ncbi:glycosyl hydrolase [Flexithrix dorotheae]|uniref:glycosyl hydrolase n=1 Tax=Flexithrix dorotheae TaxID=70993 RepID=UPI00036BF1DC|nr:glycosyl hydrolase [Flexithrix dorotheae]
MKKHQFLSIKSLFGTVATAAFLLFVQMGFSQNPVNPNASPEARALLQYLYDTKGQGIITGQHNEQSDPDGWDNQLKSRNGNVEPALWGNDFRYGSNVQYRQRWIDEAIDQWEQKGKIITIMYHQVRPMDSETSGWSSVQGELSYSEFENLLTDGHWIHEAWEDKMDDIAYYLQQLEDANIPVLFRPYHEMNGGWFWWGAKSSGDQYKRLFRMTYNYLTNTKGLNNLLWVLNFDDTNNNLSAYHPGNNYVDAFATDIYNANFSQSHYNAMQSIANGKPIAIGEVGDMISMSQIESNYGDYVWLMGWRELFVNNNSSSTLTSIFSDNYAINANDLPDLKNYNGGGGNNNPVQIPAQIEAEDYSNMSGIETQGTSDTGGGLNVGYFDPGDWVEYLVDAQSSNTYEVKFRVATSRTGAQLRIASNGNTLKTVDIPNTGGWQTWVTISTTVSLNAGEQTIRLTAVTENSNINWLDFSIDQGGGGGGSIPWCAPSDFSISGSNTTTWSSGTIDISGSPVDINMDILASGSLDAGGDFGDYLNIYYKVNGGSNQTIEEISGPSSVTSASVTGITGSTLEIIIQARTTAPDELYEVNNLCVTAGSGGTDDVPFCAPTNYAISGNATTIWTSGVIDISATSSVDISMDVLATGDLDATGDFVDYLNIYYKVDGGSNQVIEEIVGPSSITSAGASNISGNTLEIIIEGHTTGPQEVYEVSNVCVNASGNTRKAKKGEPLKSLNNELNIKEISVYPNPVKHDLTVILPSENTGVYAIGLFDLSGRKVLDQIVRKTENNEQPIILSLGSLDSGLYILKVKSSDNQGNISRKIMKVD